MPFRRPNNSVQMLLEHHFLEALTGLLEGLNAANALAAAIPAAALAQAQAQQVLAVAPIVMPIS